MSEHGSFFSKLSGSFRSDEPEYYTDEYPTADQPVYADAMNPGDAQLSLDMFDTGDEIIIQTIIAGVRIEDIDISISRTRISIQGFRENPFEDSLDASNYVCQELFWGPFSRELDLPDEIDIDSPVASEEHGLLTIRLTKTDKERISRVKIK
jgi:HSP20 family molecular chaperone IbpA